MPVKTTPTTTVTYTVAPAEGLFKHVDEARPTLITRPFLPVPSLSWLSRWFNRNKKVKP